MDWRKIKREYITTDTSYRKLCEKYGVNRRTLEDRASKEGWVELRRQRRGKAVAKIIDSCADREAESVRRLQTVTEKLLAKVERAVEELDLTLVTNTEKVKVIEYNNEERPDKPTKETVTETVEVLETRTIIDRAGLKAITSALRDIKEVQMLRTELDRQEQEARIAKLRKEAAEEQTDNKLEVVFIGGGDLEEWSK